ncbi:hypothetical protein FSP39_024982 [Pinctada imbricata]|uniref:Uncharacterized protein n=1 Tax=Pinctada imbricata TaxID=66713 RepID=A0AA88XR60_PINIB|nr:hypothetical protein FSP39_024982 [Pinctada imbricata]
MPEQISVSGFVKETWDDFNSPTTSTFSRKMGHCRNLVSSLEERLDQDRSGLTKTKKSAKALYNSIKRHVDSDNTLAENLESLCKNSQDQDPEIGEAFKKFAHVTKELSSSMNDMVTKLNSMLLYPLESFLKGDLKGVKGDMKKPFDKAWKEYEGKFSKIEKEKKQQAKEAGMIRNEVSGAEIAEDMEKERKVFQLQLCEYLIKVNEIKTKKGVELLLHLVEYYKALTTFFQEGLKTINHFESFIEVLITQLQKIKAQQNQERQQLVELRDSLKGSMTSYKEPTASKTPAGYSLHQLHGNKIHGCQKEGYLLKKSEGKVRKVWQKRKCIINEGIMLVSHSDEAKDPVKLNLLTCQVKLVPDDIGKKCFDLVSSSNNRTYHFQADDEKNMEEWISVLNNAKEEVLLKAFQSNSNSPSLNQNVRELTTSIIDRVKRLPGNRHCCDCGAPDPEWLSTNLGILICLECCGIHRQLGVHISRTQSLVIDELGTSQLLLARVVGNGSFNEIMEAKLDSSNLLKLQPSSQMAEREQYIFSKYEQHKYAIITSTDRDELGQDLKQAVLQTDMMALLQVYAEGMDLMSVLPEMENGETALHLAIDREDGYSLHIVDFIIQNSSLGSLAAKTKDGSTPLHLCTIKDKTECMKLLLRTKPDLAGLENSDGKTCLDIAEENGFQLCADLLKAAISGRKDLFEHVNVDWDLIVEDHETDPVDFSDDDLENTPERKSRSRPPSLVPGISSAESSVSSLSFQKDGQEIRERSDSTRSLQPPDSFKKKMPSGYTLPQNLYSNSTSNGNAATLPMTNQGLANISLQDSGSSNGNPNPPLPPRLKRPPPPPPKSAGHTRNKSEGNMSGVVHRRSTSDPPPRPAPPDRSTICVPSTSAKPVLPPKDLKYDIYDGSVMSNGPDDDKDPPPLPAPRQKKKSPIGQRCQALYDCDADNDDELTFREGETIVILREEEEDWWLEPQFHQRLLVTFQEGEIEGQPLRRGLFPKTFVELLS